jgi:hypothetical protein
LGNALVVKALCAWSSDSLLYKSSSRKPERSTFLTAPKDHFPLTLPAGVFPRRLRCVCSCGKGPSPPLRSRPIPPTSCPRCPFSIALSVSSSAPRHHLPQQRPLKTHSSSHPAAPAAHF